MVNWYFHRHVSKWNNFFDTCLFGVEFDSKSPECKANEMKDMSMEAEKKGLVWCVNGTENFVKSPV